MIWWSSKEASVKKLGGRIQTGIGNSRVPRGCSHRTVMIEAPMMVVGVTSTTSSMRREAPEVGLMSVGLMAIELTARVTSIIPLRCSVSTGGTASPTTLLSKTMFSRQTQLCFTQLELKSHVSRWRARRLRISTVEQHRSSFMYCAAHTIMLRSLTPSWKWNCCPQASSYFSYFSCSWISWNVEAWPPPEGQHPHQKNLLKKPHWQLLRYPPPQAPKQALKR